MSGESWLTLFDGCCGVTDDAKRNRSFFGKERPGTGRRTPIAEAYVVRENSKSIPPSKYSYGNSNEGEDELDQEESGIDPAPTRVMSERQKGKFLSKLHRSGFVVEKISKKGKPKPVMLCCDRDFTKIYWYKKNQNKETGKKVEVSELTGVLRGLDPDPYFVEYFGTETLRKKVSFEDGPRCFALIWPERGSLDLRCQGEDVCDELVTGLRNLLGKLEPPAL